MVTCGKRSLRSAAVGRDSLSQTGFVDVAQKPRCQPPASATSTRPVRVGVVRPQAALRYGSACMGLSLRSLYEAVIHTSIPCGLVPLINEAVHSRGGTLAGVVVPRGLCGCGKIVNL